MKVMQAPLPRASVKVGYLPRPSLTLMPAGTVPIRPLYATVDFTGDGNIGVQIEGTWSVTAAFTGGGALKLGLLSIRYVGISCAGSGDLAVAVVQVMSVSADFTGDGALAVGTASLAVATFAGVGAFAAEAVGALPMSYSSSGAVDMEFSPVQYAGLDLTSEGTLDLVTVSEGGAGSAAVNITGSGAVAIESAAATTISPAGSGAVSIGVASRITAQVFGNGTLAITSVQTMAVTANFTGAGTVSIAAVRGPVFESFASDARSGSNATATITATAGATLIIATRNNFSKTGQTCTVDGNNATPITTTADDMILWSYVVPTTGSHTVIYSAGNSFRTVAVASYTGVSAIGTSAAASAISTSPSVSPSGSGAMCVGGFSGSGVQTTSTATGTIRGQVAGANVSYSLAIVERNSTPVGLTLGSSTAWKADGVWLS